MDRADRRRNVFIEKKRARACKNNDATKGNRVRQVKRLQRWWRHERIPCRRINRITKINGEELLSKILSPFDESNRIDFEEIVMHLSKPDVLSAAKLLLEETCLPPRTKGIHISSVRSVLAAFMINRHAEEVLGSIQDEDQEKKQARHRLERISGLLESRMFALKRSLQKKQKRNMNILMLRNSQKLYGDLFREWKQIDLKRLAEELLQAYIAIKQNHIQSALQLEQSSFNDPGLQQYVEGLEQQLKSLETRLKKLLGKEKCGQWLDRAQTFINDSANDAEPEDEPACESEENDDSPKAVIPQYTLPKASIMPSNERMAYELMLDPEFKLEATSDKDKDENKNKNGDSVNEVIRGNAGDGTEMIYRRFTDDLRQGKYEKLVAVLINIRERLIQLTPNRTDLKNQLNDAIDESLIRQQLKEKAFDKKSLFNIISFLGQRIINLQAPARNEDTNMWLKKLNEAHMDASNDWETLTPAAVNYALNEIAKIELDMANFHLSVLGQHVQGENGIKYQRATFEKKINSGEYRCGHSGVPCDIEAWIFDSRSESSSLISCLRTAFAKLICFESDNATEFIRSMPETLRRFDVERILHINYQGKTLVTGVVLEVLYSQVLGKKPSQSMVAVLRERLRVLLKDPSITAEDIQQEMLLRVKEALPGLTQDEENNLVSLVKQSRRSALFKTVMRRFELFLKSALKEGFQEKNLQRLGLAAWTAEAKEIFEEVAKLFQLNNAIYEPFYERAYSFRSE
eukprot:CAMPEP_0204842776 /NCGR_PEP_ID=MMETSP1346-20131115/47584_1 /ASSEMBLY_ACC=CAM_ASM_000771 /TAXON_ID=215587 /ORGANISM="Aplanochytrium stocchinoi, Strain GSBS06" /LENGTH=744 /DNA_ID=CAMNT_0051981803 /DNA_START=416 /DNA_END=2650 /DNA_ORIENTATION=+